MRQTLSDTQNSAIVKTIITSLFNKNEIETIKRPACYIIRLRKEPNNKIHRIILLPPGGFTANNLNETNPHPEARNAKIEIKGGVKPNKSGFNLLKDCIKYQYYTIRNVNISQDDPYPVIGGEHYKEDLKSSREKFFVVKENGIGFYHSLVNLSDEWILLVLEKDLIFQKDPGLDTIIKNLDKHNQEIINQLYEKIVQLGDMIFERERTLIVEVCNCGVDKVAPPLIEMLNILETGKHEACTVFAIILKIGKGNPLMIDYLKQALRLKIAPHYYLEELIKKLSK